MEISYDDVVRAELPIQESWSQNYQEASWLTQSPIRLIHFFLN